MADELPPVPNSTQDNADRILALLCHLSIFVGVAFLLPLIVYCVRRQSPFVADHAKEALNFHITLIFYGIICAVLCFFLIGFVLAGALALFAMVCAIIAAIRAMDGGFYRYPITLRLIS